MPLGGAAIMRKGPNLLKLPRKEHCLALTTQLRNKFKIQPCFYRVFPTGEVEYLHPKDGVYPEKVNAGREGANQNMRRIGENVNPIKVGGRGRAGRIKRGAAGAPGPDAVARASWAVPRAAPRLMVCRRPLLITPATPRSPDPAGQVHRQGPHGALIASPRGGSGRAPTAKGRAAVRS